MTYRIMLLVELTRLSDLSDQSRPGEAAAETE